MIGLIEVPAQADSRKPFLVRGTSDSGLGFTWARRTGDRITGPNIETAHAPIRAGDSVLAARDSDRQADELRAELEALGDASLPPFLQGIPDAARAAGFRVRRDGGQLTFSQRGFDSIAVSLQTIGPPADLGQREELLRRLADQGLPVSRTSRGYLRPSSSNEEQI